MKKTDFTLTRVKSIFKNDEAKAFKSVLEKTGLKKEDLIPAHTDKQFIWVKAEDLNFEPSTNDETEPESQFPIVEFAMDDYTEADAVGKAMSDLDTFESNLRALHSDTHYRFTKVRG